MAATNQNAPTNTPPNNAPIISPMKDAVKKIIEEHVAPLKAEVDRMHRLHRIQSIDLIRLKTEMKALMDAHREEQEKELEDAQ
ncbi:hypothetical protein RHGRI_027231 [Rhododendron griersonianum]|uniref:Uncharacterized protein n=1 Tax=Rhododendron griersonianum TaxID=479676 RepID=A0AAV6J030_9ERIC|nr:hypothetical protein RHGRI_027231 [Rhododendron griersonianum]